MIKLILSDMDGTLLNDRDQIPDDFWAIQKTLYDKGIIFAIASGRPYYNLINKFDKIKNSLLFICENGSLVMYQGKEIFSNPMSNDEIHRINAICRNINNIVPIFCGKTSAYIERKIFENSSLPIQQEIRKYYTTLSLVETIEEVKEEFIKVAICDFDISELNSFTYFKEYQNLFQVVISGKVWLDISKKGTNKGVAVKNIQKKFGISSDETMAFGDYLNDYDMMKLAKFSYAMKNAHPDLIKISNYITKYDNNDNGVTQTLKEFFDI